MGGGRGDVWKVKECSGGEGKVGELGRSFMRRDGE